MTKIKHVYIHVPISNSNCKICDKDKVVNFSLSEIISGIQNTNLDEELDTLYIGGLNPGYLSDNNMKLLFQAINARFNSIKEFTFETYCENVSQNKINLFKKSGVNRVVLKAKTFNTKILHKWSMKQNVRQAFNGLKSAGIENISIDLNFGLGSSILKDDVKRVLSLNPESIHWYSHDLEGEAKELRWISNLIIKAGYNRYGLTDFAKKNYESKHNIAYWKSKNCFGVGKGSHSFVEGTYNSFRLGKKELAQHIIIMALHHEKGLELDISSHLFAYNFFKETFQKLLKSNELSMENNSVFIPEEKWENIDYILNKVL